MNAITDAPRDIRIAHEEDEVRRCWPAFRELRPHLQSAEEFIARWRAQVGEGYRIAYILEGDRVPAAAGYRLMSTMAWGRILYLDDLVAVAASHGTGLGTALLRFLQGEARRLGCDALHLDTGYQRHRAHRTYLRNGFRMDCMHLAWKVEHD
jgi:GNAT superfamily N-acetyltransferase